MQQLQQTTECSTQGTLRYKVPKIQQINKPDVTHQSNPEVTRHGDAKRRQILLYLMEYSMEHGYAPTTREICEAVHLKSTSSVYSHLSTMETQGLVIRDSSKPRALTITAPGYTTSVQNTVVIPFIKSLHRNNLLCDENIMGYISQTDKKLSKDKVYAAYRLNDNNNTETGFYKDDLLIVELTGLQSWDHQYRLYEQNGRAYIEKKEIDKETVKRTGLRKIGCIACLLRNL